MVPLETNRFSVKHEQTNGKRSAKPGNATSMIIVHRSGPDAPLLLGEEFSAVRSLEYTATCAARP